MHYSKDKAVLIHADGVEEEIVPKDVKKGFSLEELQKYVKGRIEILSVKADSRMVLVINEEGKLEGLPENKKATELWGYGEVDEDVFQAMSANRFPVEMVQELLEKGDVVVGDVVYCYTAMVH